LSNSVKRCFYKILLLNLVSSFSKHDKKTESVETPARPFELLVKLFTRNPNTPGHKRNESCSFSHNSSTNSKLKSAKVFDYVLNTEITIIKQGIGIPVESGVRSYLHGKFSTTENR